MFNREFAYRKVQEKIRVIVFLDILSNCVCMDALKSVKTVLRVIVQYRLLILFNLFIPS
jgi:hypothetical protein